MKIFISWSGITSRSIAETLRKFFPMMMQGIEVFMSKQDLESGTRWSNELSNQLDAADFGIICLTNQNKDKPWILFEAGALSKHLHSRVCSLLIGNLSPTDISGPLSQFQNRHFCQEEFSKLVYDINQRQENPLIPNQLDLILEKWWPDIEKEYQNVLNKSHEELAPDKRNDRDLLEEMLIRLRELQNIRNPQTVSDASKKLHDLIRYELSKLNEEELYTLHKIATSCSNGAGTMYANAYNQKAIESLTIAGLLFRTEHSVGFPAELMAVTINCLLLRYFSPQLLDQAT